MNISVSDIIWTVICFGLFTLVINLMLFRPVRKVMDERKRKINEAKSFEESERETEAFAREKAIADRENKKRKAEAETKRLIEESTKRNAAEIKELSQKLADEDKRVKEALPALERAADEAFDSAMDDMVEAFTKKLVFVKRDK